MARARIAPADLADADGRLPFDRYVALMRAGQDLCGDPALSLRFGEAVDVTEISVGCSIGGATTMDAAVAQINRYARLGVDVECVGNGDRLQLSQRGGQLWVIDCRRNPNDFPELTESTFARMVCSTRRVMGDAMLEEVHFTHAEPAYRAEYDRIFRVPLVFGSDKNALRLDSRLSSVLKPPPSSSYISAVLRDHAESLLARLDSERTVRARVERVLMPMLEGGRAGVEAVCREMGLSRQTLFRRLKAEGVTYEKVLDDLRRTLALHHLTVSGASVTRTAYLVGYSDPAAFSRAFKRWTGSNPRRHIAQHR